MIDLQQTTLRGIVEPLCGVTVLGPVGRVLPSFWLFLVDPTCAVV